MSEPLTEQQKLEQKLARMVEESDRLQARMLESAQKLVTQLGALVAETAAQAETIAEQAQTIQELEAANSQDIREYCEAVQTIALKEEIARLELCTYCHGEMAVPCLANAPGVEDCMACPVCRGTGQRVPDETIKRLRHDSDELVALQWFDGQQRAEIAALQEQVSRLRHWVEEGSALARYVRHDSDCGKAPRDGADPATLPCTCGLDEVRACYATNLEPLLAPNAPTL